MRPILILPLVVLSTFLIGRSGSGQEVTPIRELVRLPGKTLGEARKIRQDYPGPVRYTPCDPWRRSRRFLRQTGHAGFFYNCDQEECKRHSPWISWNSQHDPDWRNGLRWALRKDRADVRQRIADGACLD